MSLYNQFSSFNKVNFDKFIKLFYFDQHIGYIFKDNIDILIFEFNNVFKFKSGYIYIHLKNNHFDYVSDIFVKIANQAFEVGLIDNLTSEYFSVFPCNYNFFKSELKFPLFKIDRSLLLLFGIKASGIHLNAYTIKSGEKYMWIAKRNVSKKVCPSKLDNIVAGGISYGHTPISTLYKEAKEEASISQALIDRSVSAVNFSYLYEYNNGIRNDVIFTFDLEVDNNFVPAVSDGEVESFRLISCYEVCNLLTKKDIFKFNSAWVAINFLLRHTLVKADAKEIVKLKKMFSPS